MQETHTVLLHLKYRYNMVVVIIIVTVMVTNIVGLYDFRSFFFGGGGASVCLVKRVSTKSWVHGRILYIHLKIVMLL